MAGTYGFRIEPGRQGAERIPGLRQTQRALRQVSEDSRADMKDVHRAAAEIVAEDARKRAPVRSGRLRSSIRGTAVLTGGRVRIGYGGGRPAQYGGPTHFGWPARRIRPQPFVYDALDPRRPDVLKLYEERMDELTKKYGLR